MGLTEFATGVAVLVHVFIFAMESLFWRARWVGRVFGMRSEEREHNRLFAFNQGVYNLALAAIGTAGLIALGQGATQVGLALVSSACGAMLLAAVALVVSATRLWQAAIVQGGPPLLALVGVALGG
jgi:putative membrane protein